MNDDVERSAEEDDDTLLARLRTAVSMTDPVPAELIAAARSSFMWHTIDAELAELAYDSHAAAGQGASTRSAGGERMLCFESEALAVELEASGAGTGAARRLVGQVVPPQRATIEVRHRGGVTTVDADEMGGFAAGGLAPGPVSIRCRPAGGESGTIVDTDWFLV